MKLFIHNSLTKKKEEFIPLDPAGKQVKMYVCGPTVYDEPHIGHLRSAFVFDMMRRFMTHLGFQLTFVRNVTDVDDKIIQKARESQPTDLNSEVQKVSEKYFLFYKQDLQKLGILEPTTEPRATTHIHEMHELIAMLIQKEYAYQSAGDVYFDVNRFAEYGKLSHQNKEAILQNVRIEKNEKKRDVLDFALWKSVKEGEPSWSSPWGPGRPGWHIECSAMSHKHLGETFDIHGGGRDLIFPHHENEVAQSEAAHGKTFARYWVHHGLITVDEQKMSKSLKNFITLTQVMASGETRAEELKFLFLGTHYSAPLDYSEEKMAMVKSIRSGFIQFLAETQSLGQTFASSEKYPDLSKLVDAFVVAMSDDFNTPLALKIMHDIVSWGRSSADVAQKAAAGEALKTLFKILNLSYEDITVSFPPEIDKVMTNLINQRRDAKSTKDFSRADALRKEIDTLAARYGKKLVDKKGGEYEFQYL